MRIGKTRRQLFAVALAVLALMLVAQPPAGAALAPLPPARAAALGNLGATVQNIVATALRLIGGGGQPTPPTPPPPAPADPADSIQVSGDDVFVIIGSTLRHPDDSTSPSAPLFNVAGVSMNVTWGAWAASATSAVRTTGGPHPATDVEQRFANLIPGGTYSVFWGTLNPDSENPACPGVERTLPLTSVDASQQPDASSFVAGPDGSATFRGRVDKDLFEATQVYFTVIYHLDRQTWGSLPNHGEFNTQGPECRSSFGDDAMRQLLILQKW